MEIPYDKIYLNVERPKRAQVVLVALPMYRYRVEMSVYEHGLNFFQKQVLRLKARPLLTEERISELLGIDINVIGRVRTELENKDLLNAHGGLTDAGREKLNDLEGLVVNSGKKTMGYVFQYVDTGKRHPQVIHQLQPADLVVGADGERPRVNDRTKGDEDSSGSKVTYLEALFRNRGIFDAPEERTIAQMVLKTGKRSADAESAAGKSLGVRLMDRNPQLVWVCTYVFLPKVQGEDYYASDWKVLDPSGQGDSLEEDGSSADLRYYLKDLDDKYLNERISYAFDGLKTIGGKKRSEYLEELDKRVEECVESEMIGLDRIDKNIREAARQVVRCYLEWSDGDYRDQRLVEDMAAEMIKAIESMLGVDKHQRKNDYDAVSKKLGKDASEWGITIQHGLKQHFKEELTNEWFSITERTDFRYSSDQLEMPKGFADKLWGFIASSANKDPNRMTRALKRKLKGIHAINSVRRRIHGTTEYDEKREDVSKKDGLRFYEVFKEIVNDYAKNG